MTDGLPGFRGHYKLCNLCMAYLELAHFFRHPKSTIQCSMSMSRERPQYLMSLCSPSNVSFGGFECVSAVLPASPAAAALVVAASCAV
jgi:hypothetical protein